jgi:1-phosphofructokinase
MKIVAFTLNPAVDQTIYLDRLVPGEVHRALNSFTRAGGKGINVSANVAGYGLSVLAGGFLGTGNAAIFESHFSEANIDDGFIRVAGENRTNIKIVDAAGTTEVNMKGIEVSEKDLEKLALTAESLFSDESGLAVLSGSLPSGCPPDYYRLLIGKLKKRGGHVFLDADGAALEKALSADVLPDGLKPNLRELSEWAGRPLKSHGEISAAARALLARGLKLVVVSMGGEGALFVGPEQVFHAVGRPERIASTVGAGDAMMAGLVSAWAAGPAGFGADLERLAKLSTAFAAAWLENSAAGKPAAKKGGEFRQQIESAMDKVSVKKI